VCISGTLAWRPLDQSECGTSLPALLGKSPRSFLISFYPGKATMYTLHTCSYRHRATNLVWKCRNLKPRAWRPYLFWLILLSHSAPADYLQPGRVQDITRTNSAALGKQCKAFLRRGSTIDIPSAPVHFPHVPRAAYGMHYLRRFW
jgi:hypothetical protein